MCDILIFIVNFSFLSQGSQSSTALIFPNRKETLTEADTPPEIKLDGRNVCHYGQRRVINFTSVYYCNLNLIRELEKSLNYSLK